MNKEEIMRVAIEEAKKARLRGDYAIGAVIAKGGEIISCGGNRVITKNDSTRHIELEMIQSATGMQKERYLDEHTLFTTAEPCLMCLGACWWSGIRKVFYGISQHDIKEYGEKHGTKTHRYRSSPMSSTEIISTFDVPIELEQIMRDECLQALYENNICSTPV